MNMGLFLCCLLLKRLLTATTDRHDCKALPVGVADIINFVSLGVGENVFCDKQIDAIDFNCMFFFF